MKRGTTDIAKVYRGTTQVKKIYRGTSLVWSDWVLKTGNLYVMTSNSAPSPFVAGSYYSGALFIYREPYQSFNNNTGDNYQGSINSGYFGAYLNFNKTVKIKTITPTVTTNTYGSGGNIWYKVDIKLPSGSYQEVFSVVLSQGVTYSTPISLTIAQQVECIGIRHRAVWYSGDFTPVLLKKCQVTEWYEK